MGLLMAKPGLSREEIRDFDCRATEQFGVPGVVLMENAGRGCAELVMNLGIDGLVAVCAGKGNNGGDGFVIARHLENQGYEVQVFLFCDPEELQGDAQINFQIIQSAGMRIHVMGTRPDPDELTHELATADWIVDALLGTGTHGGLCEPFLMAIGAINLSSSKVLAVDLPSGMNCDTGRPIDDATSGICVRADHTATFVAGKLGFGAAGAEELTGVVHVIDIGAPRAVLE